MTDAAPRTYNSPLREQQARATRDQILEGLIDLINEVGAFDLNIKDLAGRAGVSERTIYRHFPDRTALLDGLFAYLDDRANWTTPRDIDRASDFSDVVGRSWQAYDEFARETRALVLMNLDPARTANRSRQNTVDIQAIIARSYPDLTDQDVVGIAAVFNLLASSRAWLRMLDGHGLSGEQAFRYIGWAADLLTAELDAGNRGFAVDDDG